MPNSFALPESGGSEPERLPSSPPYPYWVMVLFVALTLVSLALMMAVFYYEGAWPGLIMAATMFAGWWFFFWLLRRRTI